MPFICTRVCTICFVYKSYNLTRAVEISVLRRIYIHLDPIALPVKKRKQLPRNKNWKIALTAVGNAYFFNQ